MSENNPPVWTELENRIKEQGHTLELTHNKLELIENRLASNDKNIAMLAGDLVEMKKTPPTPDKSEIYGALAKAQESIHNATTNTDNEFTKKKYANLASVMDAVRKPLAENGIALFQVTEDPGQGVLGIRTVLAHESGQTIQDVITMAPPKLDPQGIGSCRTYMRRYAVLAMCGIAGAADDDAESTKADPEDYERLTSAEVDKVLMQADEMFGDRTDAVIAKMLDRVFGLKRLGDVKAGEFDVVMNQLKNANKLMKDAVKKGDKKKPSPKPPEAEEREPGSDDE